MTSSFQAGPPFTSEDLFSVLGGQQELSEDQSRVTIRKAWGGRTFEVEVEGAVAYLNDEFYPKHLNPAPKAREDALSYFDLEIQEFTGTTPTECDPIILDREGLRLTGEFRSLVEYYGLAGGE